MGLGARGVSGGRGFTVQESDQTNQEKEGKEMRMTFQKPIDQEPEILAPGWYDFTVAHVYDTDRDGNPLTSKTGTSYLKVVCHEDESAKVIYHLLFLEPDNAKKISAFLWACQVDLEHGQEVEVSAAMFTDKAFRGRVETNPGFDGVHRNRIIRVVRQEDEEKPEDPDKTNLHPELDQEPGPDNHHEQGEDAVPF
jgi:hypothetical protein